jgi:hypothetical protein
MVPARCRAYMLNEVEEIGVEEGHRPEPPVLAGGDSGLVEE